MTKGTPSKGKRSGKRSHVLCRRCGKRTYHARHGVCASCGFGASSRMRKYNWQNKRRGKRLK